MHNNNYLGVESSLPKLLRVLELTSLPFSLLWPPPLAAVADPPTAAAAIKEAWTADPLPTGPLLLKVPLCAIILVRRICIKNLRCRSFSISTAGTLLNLKKKFDGVICRCCIPGLIFFET